MRFAYSTNGHNVIEYDMANGGKSRVFPMSQFPTPDELAQQYGKDERSELEKVCQWKPFAHPGGKFTRYYQEWAVEAVIAKLGRGEKRALLTLATGTGKTFIAYQLCRKFVLARWSNTKPLGSREPTILFIMDRNILADQALGDFYFQEHACFRYLAGTDKVPMDRLVYFTLFQTLLGEDGRDTKYKKFKPDFFDIVIVDECHRGGRNDESQWRKILDYFSWACHVGLTATKDQTDPHYCEVVTADAGKIGEGYLKQFQNNENTIPTILTTSEKLSTGVNAVNIRSIVLFRNVNSMVEFKQIVGRGTRVCEGKGYCKIYDFTDATDKFKDPAWDGEVVCPK